MKFWNNQKGVPSPISQSKMSNYVIARVLFPKQSPLLGDFLTQIGDRHVAKKALASRDDEVLGACKGAKWRLFFLSKKGMHLL